MNLPPSVRRIVTALAIVACGFVGMGLYYGLARVWHVYWFVDAAYEQDIKNQATRAALQEIQRQQQEAIAAKAAGK